MDWRPFDLEFSSAYFNLQVPSLMHRPKKRRRNNVYTEELPLGDNDFTFGRSQEVVLQLGLPTTMPISPQKGSKSWIKVAHWEPEDRTDYALDPASEGSNDNLWKSSIYTDKGEGIVPEPQAPSKRKKRSLQSVSFTSLSH